MSRGDKWTHTSSKTARQKGAQYLWDGEVYEYATEAEARARTGPNPDGRKWIDTNKGSAEAPRYARVWCGRRYATKETNRSSQQRRPWKLYEFCSVLRVRKDVFRVEDSLLISIGDVSRVHFFADPARDVNVRLPNEDPKAKEPGVCGKLRKTMYGSLGAGQRWREHYAREDLGDRRGLSVPFLP